jgi:uncharacterized protein
MSERVAEGLLVGPPDRRLFAVFRPATGPVRAALLFCPPFFHEQFLSYRLLSLMGARLAARGIASLRFDYYGTGDSPGAEEDFSLAGAIADAGVAFDALAERLPGVPIAVCGARAGAWPAARVAVRRGVPLVLWQPLHDGAAWLRTLTEMDASERASRERYAFLGAPKSAEPDRLIASYCPSALRREIDAVRLADILAGSDVTVDVVDGDEAAALPRARRTLRFPEAAGRWHAKIDIRVAIVTREMAACIDTLADGIGAAS